MMHRPFATHLMATLVIAATTLVAGVPGQAPAPGAARPCAGCGIAPEPIDNQDFTGWTPMFDGKTLDGWDGNPEVWRVENGAIAAESTANRRVGTTYLIWKGGQPADFELKLEIKAESDIHGGVFYRGKVGPGPARAGRTRSGRRRPICRRHHAGCRNAATRAAGATRRASRSQMECHRVFPGFRLRPRERRQRAGHRRTDGNTDRLARPHRANGSGPATALDWLAW